MQPTKGHHFQIRNFAALVLLLSVPVFAAAQKPKGG